MNNIPLCFIDTETTELARDIRQAWEIAMIRREPDGTEHRVAFFVSGLDFSQASRKSLDVGRFYERYRMDHEIRGVTPDEPDYVIPLGAARRVERMTRDAHLVACVPSFDEHHLIHLLAEAGLAPAWHYRLRCVETLVLGYLAAKGIELPPLDGRSDELFALVGIDTSKYDRHTALGDAKLARDVWDTVMRRTPQPEPEGTL